MPKDLSTRAPTDLSVNVEGGHSSSKSICLDPNVEHMPHDRIVTSNHHERSSYARKVYCKSLGPGWSMSNIAGLQCPCVRSDGWLEIGMGEFFNSSLEDKEVQMSVIVNKSLTRRKIYSILKE